LQFKIEREEFLCFVVAQSRLLNEKFFLAVAEFFFAEFGILCLNAAHTQDEQESQGIKSSFYHGWFIYKFPYLHQ
jgi:hypothetical protein